MSNRDSGRALLELVRGGLLDVQDVLASADSRGVRLVSLLIAAGISPARRVEILMAAAADPRTTIGSLSPTARRVVASMTRDPVTVEPVPVHWPYWDDWDAA